MLSRICSESVDSPERRIASTVWRIASTTSVRGWRSKRSLTSDLSSRALTLGKFRRGSALICVPVATQAVEAAVAADVVSSVDASLAELSSERLLEERRAKSSLADSDRPAQLARLSSQSHRDCESP